MTRFYPKRSDQVFKNDHNSNPYQREIALLILYQFMGAGQMRACAKSGIVLLMSDVIF